MRQFKFGGLINHDDGLTGRPFNGWIGMDGPYIDRPSRLRRGPNCQKRSLRTPEQHAHGLNRNLQRAARSGQKVSIEMSNGWTIQHTSIPARFAHRGRGKYELLFDKPCVLRLDGESRFVAFRDISARHISGMGPLIVR